MLVLVSGRKIQGPSSIAESEREEEPLIDVVCDLSDFWWFSSERFRTTWYRV